VPLVDGAWGASGIVPQDAAEVPDTNNGKFVVCVNCDTTHALTLTVGGAELQIPATNGFVRNLEVYKGDSSVAVTAASASARVRLAIAINPWIEFVGGPMFTGHDTFVGQVTASTMITNCWTFVAWRGEISGGNFDETLYINDRDGVRETERATHAHPSSALTRNARHRISLSSPWGVLTSGGTRRAVDVWGYKQFTGRLSDAEIWRVWELDLAEIRRRGLDTAIWAAGEGPQ
jgi:hypothetical protein